MDAMLPMQAIRAARKAMRPIDESFAMAFDADAAICPDGYGTSYLCDAFDAAREKVLKMVASRFGLSASELDYAIQGADMEETYRFQHAGGAA